MIIQNQASPPAQHIAMIGSDASEGSIEMTIIDDQMMSVFPGVGCSIIPASSLDGQSPQDDFFDIDEVFTGKAKRVETDISIEGIPTDRYELNPENIAEGGEAFPEDFTGSIYVAQDGGYIVRVEMSGTGVGDEAFGMDPSAEATLDLTYTFTPVEAGSLSIAAPAECADQVN